jgi:hypothetical protein
MNVNQIRDWVNFELNKHQSGNTLNKEEYNLCLAWANAEYFKIKYGLPEEYRPGMPLPRQAWAVSQKIIDDLRRFLVGKGGKNLPQLTIDINGYADLPDDYIHYSSIRYNGRAVETISNDVLGDRLQSSIVYPDKSYPLCVFYDTYLQFYPKDLGYVDFDYLRMPITPYWDAVIVDDEYVYKPSSSVQLEWPDDTHTDIANLIIKYASENIRDFGMTQLAKQRQNDGQ